MKNYISDIHSSSKITKHQRQPDLPGLKYCNHERRKTEKGMPH
jgi:hypothetical protein